MAAPSYGARALLCGGCGMRTLCSAACMNVHQCGKHPDGRGLNVARWSCTKYRQRAIQKVIMVVAMLDDGEVLPPMPRIGTPQRMAEGALLDRINRTPHVTRRARTRAALRTCVQARMRAGRQAERFCAAHVALHPVRRRSGLARPPFGALSAVSNLRSVVPMSIVTSTVEWRLEAAKGTARSWAWHVPLACGGRADRPLRVRSGCSSGVRGSLNVGHNAWKRIAVLRVRA
eukprot:363215-Chlamydomonas_euryale.AAC.2